MSTQSNRIFDASQDEAELTLRPKRLDEFIGQKDLKKNLKIYIQAAKAREEALDHVLFYGPPGLGKTTLSQIIANELNVGIRMTSGPILTKAGDLAAILTNLQENEVLFIDEIHRLPTAVEEVLYSAMEDFSIDLVIGEGPAARAVKISLPRFTLVGATTRLGLLTNPLRDRFGIPLKLDFYSHEELVQVVLRSAQLYNLPIDAEAAMMLAMRSRGTPRIAGRLLRRIRDFAEYLHSEIVTTKEVVETLESLDIDKYGLDRFDKKYLKYIAENYKGGPVGIETIAAGLSEDKNTLEDTIEPYLLQIGFIARTPRGRVLTEACFNHLGMQYQPTMQNRLDLFKEDS
jgi:Holliday junction DNA helicase RuvB